jgi:hypothetical protein
MRPCLGLQVFFKAVLFSTLAKSFANDFSRSKPMKHVSRFCAVMILALSLTLTAYAGHIPCGVTDDPPPPTEQATSAGDIGTGITGDIQTGVVNPTIDSLLSLLQSLLAVF